MPGVGINFRLLDQYNLSDHLSAKQELLATYHLPEKSRILISVGELSKRKNHRIVIEALAMLDLPDIHFVIAGRGSQKKNLTDLAKHLGIENQIHFLNYTKNIRHLHLAADLAVLPSLREGLSRAGLEAIRDGVYLLGADIRGIKDYILNEEIGRVFDPLDAKALSILIKNNIQRPRQNLTNTTVQRLMMFDRAAVDKQMREIYQSIGE
ncbi:glycosyltransferase [Leuconostoc falkenbergense]|uniref:Glycosyltransferase n=1 Tax=Leuconostoc falkenbergense TaxID=2766470 RepID=A0A9X3IQC9_9LACO|nr:glycosyltransferase [Leuconostoc falkenbergense]